MLLSYFIGKGEKEASLVQSIGAGSNFIMLSQARHPPIIHSGQAHICFTIRNDFARVTATTPCVQTL